MNIRNRISGIVLAGGRASRLGGQDKGLLPVLDIPLIRYVLDRLEPQVSDVVISANRNRDRYAAFGHPVVSDLNSDFPGPLAGIRAALPHCRREWALVAACDSPLLPFDMAARLFSALKPESKLAIAHDGTRLQPLLMLIHQDLIPALDQALAAQQLKVETWCQEQAHVIVMIEGKEVFLNINTDHELKALESRLKAGKP